MEILNAIKKAVEDVPGVEEMSVVKQGEDVVYEDRYRLTWRYLGETYDLSVGTVKKHGEVTGFSQN